MIVRVLLVQSGDKQNSLSIYGFTVSLDARKALLLSVEGSSVSEGIHVYTCRSVCTYYVYAF